MHPQRKQNEVEETQGSVGSGRASGWSGPAARKPWLLPDGRRAVSRPHSDPCLQSWAGQIRFC